jgi:hypothetical protein
MSDFTGGSIPVTSSKIVLGKNLQFPAYGTDSLISQVLFVTGKRGSGKSWTSGVMMEEFNRLGLQFVCFDALDAHKNLKSLDGVESLEPKIGQSIDMKALVGRLSETNKSLVIKLAGLPLQMQQELIADYCEALLEAHLGKGIHTVIEECQDFIPQMGRPISFDPIVRLCKLGRALGYGATLVSQRPAGVNKEALSQASVYLVHNVINNRDLKALDEQLSFGTDKKVVKRLLNGIAAARKGEVVAYAPEYFRDQGYIMVDKIRGDRRAEHGGHNVDVQPMGFHAETERLNKIPNPVDAVSDVSSLKHLEHNPVMDLPDSLKSQKLEKPKGSGFYPNLSKEAEVETPALVKDKPNYSWDVKQVEISKPAFEYDTKAEKVTGNSRRTPLLAIGATLAISSLAYGLFRNLTE